MNLQQLNHNGKELSACVIAAVVVLVVTGISWSWVEEMNSYYTRREEYIDTRQGAQNRKYSVVIRIAIIIWLLRQGRRS